MTTGRIVLTTFVAFVVSQVLAATVHGFLLAADYAPYYGSLLRRMDGAAWQALFLPVAHLAFISALVWVYTRAGLDGSPAVQGLKLGFLGWVMGQVPLWLLWYAEQPWPGALVLKQLGLELGSSLIIGMTIAWVARPRRSSAALA